MKRLILIVILAIGVTSCVVKPYKALSTQQLELDSIYRYATDTSRNIAQTPWRDIFHSVELQELIDTVLAGNFDVRVSMLRVEQSYSMLRSSRAQIAPSFGLGVDYSGNSSVSTSTWDFAKMNSLLGASLSMNWEIDIWGKLKAGKDAAISSFWSSQQAYIAARQSLIAATATAYYNLAALDAKRLVILEAIENREAYLETTIALKEASKVNEVAVQQAISQLQDVRAALPSVEMAIATAESSLALLAGKTTLEIPRTVRLRDVNNSIDIATGTPAQLLSFRPDVRAAEMTFREKYYLEGAARAAMYPSLTLGGSVGVLDILSAHSIALNLLSGLTQPLFNGRKLRSAQEVAKAEAEIAKLEFQNTLFTALTEVNDAVISIKSYDSIVKHQKVQLKALRNAYEYSEELLLSGYATYLDVLVAQTSVYDLELTIIDSYLSAVTSRVELYRALGGGGEENNEGAVPEGALKNDPAINKKK